MRPRSFPVFGWLAFLGPFVATLSQAVTVPLWRSDLTARAVSGAEPLLQGAPSALVARLCQLLPVGQISGRGTLVSAVSVGLAGLFIYQLARDLAARHSLATPAPSRRSAAETRQSGGRSSIDGWLALGAAWSAALGGSFLTEGVVLGGAAPGAALGLGLMVLSRKTQAAARSAEPLSDEQRWVRALLSGLLLGTLGAESVWAAAAVLVFLALEQRGRPHLRLAVSAVCAALGSLALWLGPLYVGATAPTTWSLQLGDSLPWSLETLRQEIGLVLGLAAVFALVLGLRRPNRGLWALLFVLLLDLWAPLRGESSLLTLDGSASRHSLHLLALGLWSALGALGLRALAEGAVSLGLFGAQAARPLVVVLGLSSALAGAEDALRVHEARSLVGTESFTALSLGSLPAHSLVLCRSPTLTRRLLSAQASKERPDVLIVPLGWLGEARWMRQLLEREPRLEQLIRDLNVVGLPSEHALNLLADERPVFVEADADWDRRLLEHLMPSPVLAGFSPHALGRSDRLLSWETHAPGLTNLRARLTATGGGPDAATTHMLDQELTQLEAALVKAGDRKAAELVAVR